MGVLEDTGCGKVNYNLIQQYKVMRKIKWILFFSAVFVLFGACNQKPKITRFDTETSGRAIIASDECFAPIIKEELAVFLGLNPEAEITPNYMGENELFDFLLKDSIRLIIAARDITESERNAIKRMKLTPRSQKIARDGIVLITNRNNVDSLINVSTLKKIMTGEITDWNQLYSDSNSTLGKIQVVFDHPSSST